MGVLFNVICITISALMACTIFAIKPNTRANVSFFLTVRVLIIASTKWCLLEI
jgi:hypothetical protein